MAYILHIESSSTVCSVALSFNDELVAFKELNDGYTHAENIHIFIEQVLHKGKISAKQLHAIAVSSGPGSYTGLRIGFSTAKGMAFALKIPLIVVDTLKTLTNSAIKLGLESAAYCPMIDARRMEVYLTLYTGDLIELMEPKPFIITEQSVSDFLNRRPVYFFGDGMPKSRHLLQLLPNGLFLEDILPSSKLMISLAYSQYLKKDFADTAYAEPLYLKEFFFATPKK